MDAHTKSLIEEARAELDAALTGNNVMGHVCAAARILQMILDRPARPSQPIAVMLDAIGGKRS